MLNHVPYEVFSNIIKLSYKGSSILTTMFDAEDTCQPPIQATHVCRSWRIALLSDPTMWTRIKLNFTGKNSDEVEEMISRSGSALLDVYIKRLEGSIDPPQFVDLTNTLSHIHRIRNLQIFIPDTLINVVFRLLRQPAPRLQRLYFHVCDLSNEQEWDRTLQEAYPNLFLANAPNLKHVHLYISAGLKKQSLSLLKNLTRLHLSIISSTIVDGDILLAVLRLSPCLQVINILWAILDSKIVGTIQSNDRITLSCLRKLVLGGSFGIDNLNFILGCLDLDKVDFDVTCDDVYSEISDSNILLHFLATQRRLSLLSVTPYLSSDTDMAIEFSEKMVMGFPAFRPLPKDSSVFRILYNDYAPLESLFDSLKKFKMSDITHMYLEFVPAEITGLGSIFLLLNNLQLLHVNHASWNKYYSGQISTRTMYLDVLVPQVQTPNSQVEAASNSESDRDSDYESNFEATRVQFPCPSLLFLELALSDTFEEFYIQKLIQCYEIREQMGYPFKSVTVYSRCSTFVETARAWLRTYGPGCLHIHVELWKFI